MYAHFIGRTILPPPKETPRIRIMTKEVPSVAWQAAPITLLQAPCAKVAAIWEIKTIAQPLSTRTLQPILRSPKKGVCNDSPYCTRHNSNSKLSWVGLSSTISRSKLESNRKHTRVNVARWTWKKSSTISQVIKTEKTSKLKWLWLLNAWKNKTAQFLTNSQAGSRRNHLPKSSSYQ